MNLQDELDKAVDNIRANHNKIIDDWCKAYLAQLYEEGHEIKPGCFTLNEQVPTYHKGQDCMVKRYWFEKGVPDYSGWISVKYSFPNPNEHVLVFNNDEGIFRAYRDNDDKYPSWQCYPIGSYAGDGCVFGITHWMPLPEAPKDE